MPGDLCWIALLGGWRPAVVDEVERIEPGAPHEEPRTVVSARGIDGGAYCGLLGGRGIRFDDPPGAVHPITEQGRAIRSAGTSRTADLTSHGPIDTRAAVEPVILESPYGGTPAEVERHVAYARACVLDSLRRGEAPYVSHLLYTQPGILRDEVAAERAAGIDAGFAWRSLARRTVVYVDRGKSEGMRRGIAHAEAAGHAIEFRELAPDLLERLEGGDFTGPAPDLRPMVELARQNNAGWGRAVELAESAAGRAERWRAWAERLLEELAQHGASLYTGDHGDGELRAMIRKAVTE